MALLSAAVDPDAEVDEASAETPTARRAGWR